jgi:ribosomal subunit interface protein
MKIPLELNFRNMEQSDFVERKIQERCRRLDSLSNEITRCHVIVGAPHQHQHKGFHYEVHVELRVPGTELAVSRNTGTSAAHEDLYVAIRDAFQAIEKQLARWKEKRRHDVKAHSRPVAPELNEDF